MSRGPDADTLLVRAIERSADQAGYAVEVRSDWKRWASATFTGARHIVSLNGRASPGLDAWLAGLPEAEFALRGHLVADLAVEQVRRDGEAVQVSLGVLTVEQR